MQALLLCLTEYSAQECVSRLAILRRNLGRMSDIADYEHEGFHAEALLPTLCMPWQGAEHVSHPHHSSCEAILAPSA